MQKSIAHQGLYKSPLCSFSLHFVILVWIDLYDLIVIDFMFRILSSDATYQSTIRGRFPCAPNPYFLTLLLSNALLRISW